MGQPAPTNVSGGHAIHQISGDIKETTKRFTAYMQTHADAVNPRYSAYSWASRLW